MAETTTFKITEETKSTLKWISAGLAIFGLVILAKKVYQNYIRKELPLNQLHKQFRITLDSPHTQRLNTHKSQYSQFYFDKEQEIQYIEKTIPENISVEDIYLNSLLIAKEQFIKYTREMRKRRRLIRKINEDQYINIVLTYQSQVQQLLIRSRMELIQALCIDAQFFANMEENYETIQDFRALHRKSYEILKHKLVTDTNQKKISNQKLNQILQQETGFIQNKMYERLRSKLQKETGITQNQILTVIYALLEDIIYQKFGYEMEDITRKIQEIQYDTAQRDEARKKMQIEISDFNYDSFESSQDPDDAQQLYGKSAKINESTKALLSSKQDSDDDK